MTKQIQPGQCVNIRSTRQEKNIIKISVPLLMCPKSMFFFSFFVCFLASVTLSLAHSHSLTPFHAFLFSLVPSLKPFFPLFNKTRTILRNMGASGNNLLQVLAKNFDVLALYVFSFASMLNSIHNFFFSFKLFYQLIFLCFFFMQAFGNPCLSFVSML